MGLLDGVDNQPTTDKCPLCKTSNVVAHPNFLCCEDAQCRYLYMINNTYGENGKKKLVHRLRGRGFYK